MDKKTQVLLGIKDAEKKAHVLLQEALSRKDHILKHARKKAQDLEAKGMEDALAAQQKTLQHAAQNAEQVSVDAKDVRKLRTKATKRMDRAVAVVWKEFERAYR